MRLAFARLVLGLVLAPLIVSTATAQDAPRLPTELTDYVNKPDDSFSWKLANKSVTANGIVYTLDLVSQTWHGVKWDHKLQVFVPRDSKPQATMGLWNEADTPSLKSTLIGFQLANKIKAPIAILFGVPKQPLFGEKKEDVLIAETFVRYLTTEDPTWPLLFPMVKSIIRAVDALQAFAKDEWKFELKDFVVAGASKRGWTTWLTAATGDKRVKAIAPLVFDTLNLAVQMDRQVKTYGRFSAMIKDYEDRLLIPIPKTKAAQRLWAMIDPWTYRAKYTMPMMIVNGTNDEFWLLDGLNTYWDGLPGEKRVMYVPNAGHFLQRHQKHATEDRIGSESEAVPMQALNTLCVFCRSQIFDKSLPKLNCEMLCPDGAVCLDINLVCDIQPKKARMFRANAQTRDFRQCWWTEEAIDLTGKKTSCKVDLPMKGFRAALVELEFELDGLTYHLSTPVRILEPKK